MKKSFHFRQWKCLLLTSKPSAQGFTMLEVLAALMISFAFLTGTLNAMLITALMQVKAERQTQAGYWIQQDLENVRSLAAAYTSTAACSTTGVGVAFNTDTTYPVAKSGILMGKSYTLSRTVTVSGNILQITYSVGESSDSTKTLATLYTEIIPAGALNC